ncbi:AAA family ATPase [Candidatus Woesearchaeota archaeon]|nr:AAA family ATPase [Candidatus Woesearchaeota archaeon]
MMRKKVIAITGTPGAGKSTIAKALAKKSHWYRVDLSRHYAQISSGYNRAKHCYDVDMRKAERLILEEIQKHPGGVIVDTHISHLLPRKMVRVCIVVTCSDLKKLRARLRRRKYSAVKIKENMDAEIFQVCLVEARERKHTIVVVDGSQQYSLPKIMQKLNAFLQQRR